MEDFDLLALYTQRREEALEVTRSRYGGYCHTIAQNILGDSRDAEECENDAYLAAWNAIPPASPSSLRLYLGRIVRNLALDRYAANRAKKRSCEMTAVLEELETVLPGGETPEEHLSARELAEAVSRFLHEQTQSVRQAFLLRYWQGAPIRDIGRQLGMSDSRVKSLLFRTRGKLREFLEEEGLFE